MTFFCAEQIEWQSVCCRFDLIWSHHSWLHSKYHVHLSVCLQLCIAQFCGVNILVRICKLFIHGFTMYWQRLRSYFILTTMIFILCSFFMWVFVLIRFFFFTFSLFFCSFFLHFFFKFKIDLVLFRFDFVHVQFFFSSILLDWNYIIDLFCFFCTE